MVRIKDAKLQVPTTKRIGQERTTKELTATVLINPYIIIKFLKCVLFKNSPCFTKMPKTWNTRFTETEIFFPWWMDELFTLLVSLIFADQWMKKYKNKRTAIIKPKMAIQTFNK